MKTISIHRLSTGKIDLSNCRKGDKLLSCQGEILTFLEHKEHSVFPYLVQYKNGSFGTRLKNGKVSAVKSLDTDHDIVAILK